MSEEAFHAFVDARWPAMVRFAWTLVGDQGLAEDVVQTVLERVWRRWRHVRVDGAEAYCRAAIVNGVISRRRRHHFREVPLPEERADSQAVRQVGAGRPPATEDGAEGRAVHQTIWGELQSLPRRMRAVVVLRFLEDLSEAQTAELLGCSVGSVKSQTSRAMSRLRQSSEMRALVGATEQKG